MFRRRTAVPLKQFPRLLGHMSFAAMVMALGLMHNETASALATRLSPEMGIMLWHAPCDHHMSCRPAFSPWSLIVLDIFIFSIIIQLFVTK